MKNKFGEYCWINIEFVENNGGKIWAESEEGKGATFCFTLPKSKMLIDNTIF